MQGLLWLLVFAGFFYLMMRFGCGAHMVHGGHSGHDAGGRGGMAHDNHGAHAAEEKKDVNLNDPVCGMAVGELTSYRRINKGQEFRFCSQKCLDQFDVDPARYAK